MPLGPPVNLIPATDEAVAHVTAVARARAKATPDRKRKAAGKEEEQEAGEEDEEEDVTRLYFVLFTAYFLRRTNILDSRLNFTFILDF